MKKVMTHENLKNVGLKGVACLLNTKKIEDYIFKKIS